MNECSWKLHLSVSAPARLVAGAALVLALTVTASGGARSTDAGATTVTFSYTGAVQTFTVPSGVKSMNLTVAGAGGGGVGGSGGTLGGNGATETGWLKVAVGQVYDIVVGGAGGASSARGAGGGGGSFVYTPGATAPLFAAAGGGGAGSGQGGGSGQAGTLGQHGGGGNYGGGPGGNGGGGGAVDGGGGGGGFTSNGVNGSGNYVAGDGGASAANGFVGGSGASGGNGAGGFGGGAGGGGFGGGGGGGGGYSGGGGGGGTGYAGGGGGSFFSTLVSGALNVTGVGSGQNGSVVITYYRLISASTSGATSTATQGTTYLVDPGIRVHCPAGGTKCVTDLTAKATTSTPNPRIGKKHFTTLPGKHSQLRFKLKGPGPKLLTSLKSVSIVVTAKTTGNGETVITYKSITLQAPS